MDSGKGGSKGFVAAVYRLLRSAVVLMMVAQAADGNYENVYLCVLTLVLFLIPGILKRSLRVELPGALEIVILLFIFASQIMGEIRECYLTVPFWDDILHGVNGFLFAAIGFSAGELFCGNKKMQLPPLYMALTAFCFSMTIGVLWEFFEWGMDLAFGLDMQKDTVVASFSSISLDPWGHNTPYLVKNVTGTVLEFADRAAAPLKIDGYLDLGLHDTMLDLLVNLIGAALFSVLGFFYVKTSGKGRIVRMFIPRAVKKEES